MALLSSPTAPAVKAKPGDLRALVEKTLELPAMPVIATRVMRAVEDPKTTTNVLAAVIETDPGITGWIMRVVNSAAYGRQRRVTSLAQAISLLGFVELKNLVVSASMRAIYRSFGPIEKDLWLHSVAVGSGARILANRVAKKFREPAFLAGQMHDVGKLVIRNTFPERFLDALKSRPELGTIAAEEAQLGFSHVDVGALLMQRWNMPAPIEAAAFYHHDLELAQMLAAEHAQLVGCVVLANELAHRLGHGGPAHEGEGPSLAAALELFSLDEPTLAEVQVEVEEAVAAERTGM